MFYNFVNYIDRVNKIYDLTHEEALVELKNINVLLFVSFLVIIILQLIVIVSSIPIYAIIQSRKEEILKLFGTYSE
jgi:hypothetical protein